MIYMGVNKAKRFINVRLLETEYIINAYPVFYCIDTVTICSSSKAQHIVKN